MAGDLSGITGMEFPLLNYAIYLVSVVFGYDHWYGRLINLMVTSIGIWCFYDYLKSRFNSKTAFNTAFCIVFSLFYYYSRKVMPDTFSIGLIFIGLWLWNKFNITKKGWLFALGSLLVLFGILSKLPSVVVLAFALPLLFDQPKRIPLYAISLGAMGIVSGYWYFFWVPHLENTYGFVHFYMGNSLVDTFSFLKSHWPETLHMFYEKALGYSGFIASGIGLFYLIQARMLTKLITASSILLLMGFMLKSGSKFTDHNYYIMPFVPFMAFSAAAFLSNAKKWILLTALVIIATEGVARYWDDQFIKKGADLAYLDETIDPYIEQNELIVINSGIYPTPIYFAHRKGWIAHNRQLQNASYMRKIITKGCAFAIILKQRFGENTNLPYELVFENESIKLYSLQENKDGPAQ